MAKIQYNETTKRKSDRHGENRQALDVARAVFKGKTYSHEVYGGDQRTDAEKLVAIREFLRKKVLAGLDQGDEPPEADGV